MLLARLNDMRRDFVNISRIPFRTNHGFTLLHTAWGQSLFGLLYRRGVFQILVALCSLRPLTAGVLLHAWRPVFSVEYASHLATYPTMNIASLTRYR